MTGAEKEQDIGGLADDELARSQKWGREGYMLDPVAVEQTLHLPLTARLPCDIGVVGAGFLLEGEADKLAPRP